MKYAVISDVSANHQALTAVLSAIDTLGVDQIVCLGDMVGYGANPNECVEMMRDRHVLAVRGNHDAVACGLEDIWGYSPIAGAAALWTREQLTPDKAAWLQGLPESLCVADFLAVHGSPSDRNSYLFTWEDAVPQFGFLAQQNVAICLFGHTHHPAILSIDGMYTPDSEGKFILEKGKPFFINPGSVGQPRDGDPRAAFGVLDTERGAFQFVRVEYPIELAANPIIEAGLPQFLAERLFLGR